MLQTRTRDAVLFQIGLVFFLLFLFLCIFIPFWRVIMTSVTPLDIYTDRGIPFFLPFQDWSFEAFRQLLQHSMFPRALMNSAIITISGALISLVLTVLLAYGLSTRSLPGRKLIMLLILFTYLFNPGLIPVYLLVTGMKLTNNFLAIILPAAINVTNTLIVMSFFEGLPEDLKEAAKLDGANELQVLWHVILPLSKPILLTIGLFYAVYYWNEFFTPILYLNDSDLMPLPVLLRNILISASFNEYVEYNAFSSSSLEALKAAGVMIAMLPMVMLYPWIQRYFTKGTLVGGVKE
jgi:putative aldouronate transport system permease protein